MTPGDLAKSLRACADTMMRSCAECKMTFRVGCARDLKREAAAMIEQLIAERRNEKEKRQE